MTWRDPELEKLHKGLSAVGDQANWDAWVARAGPVIRTRYRNEGSKFEEVATIPLPPVRLDNPDEYYKSRVSEKKRQMAAFLCGLEAAGAPVELHDIEKMRLIDWLKHMRPALIYKLGATLLGILTSAFAGGYWFGDKVDANGVGPTADKSSAPDCETKAATTSDADGVSAMTDMPTARDFEFKGATKFELNFAWEPSNVTGRVAWVMINNHVCARGKVGKGSVNIQCWLSTPPNELRIPEVAGRFRFESKGAENVHVTVLEHVPGAHTPREVGKAATAVRDSWEDSFGWD